MCVDENKTTHQLRSEHQGRFFYFCCEECKEEFERNPQQYVSPARGLSKPKFPPC